MLHNEELENRRNLLASATGEKSEFITSEVDTIIFVYSVINAQDSVYLSEIFTHLLTYPDTPLKLRLIYPNIFGKSKGTIVTVDAINIRNPNEIITHKRLIRNYYALKALITILNRHEIPIDYALLSKAIQERCLIKAEKKKQNPKLEYGFRIYCITKLILKIYKHNGCETMLTESLKVLLPLLPGTQGLKLLNDNLDSNLLKKLLLAFDQKPEPLLHLFFKGSYVKGVLEKHSNMTIEIILSYINNKPTVLLDNEDNNLLHVCSMVYYFEFLLGFIIDINQKNREGNTALHVAARDGDFVRFKFLLQHGADPNIKNTDDKTALELVAAIEDSQIYLYASHALHGKALSAPPVVNSQKGQTCGIYAAECATLFHRNTKSNLFTKEHCRARKNGEKNIPSLRHAAKQLGSYIGEIFSDLSLSKLVELNECSTIITPVTNFETFVEVIRASLALDLPVIIPYSNKLEDWESPKAFNAHWATIIGICDDELLLANYGQYEKVATVKIYHCFYAMEDKYPLCYLFKNKPKEQWNKDLQEPSGACYKKIEFEEVDLTAGYKNRLITVCPPGFDKSKFDDAIAAERMSSRALARDLVM